MGESVASAVVSVFTSLLAWWLIARGLVPNLHVCRNISVLPERRRAHAWRYRVKVANVRRWPLRHRPVIDVRVVATLQIRGLDPDAPLNLTTKVVYFRADDFVVGRFSRRPGRAGLKIVPSSKPAMEVGPAEVSALDVMGCAWHHHFRMPSMIQIRNVPDDLHRDLKVRATHAGMTLSDYLLAELRALAVRPTMHEWLDRSATWEPVDVSEPPADAIAAERGRNAA